MKYRIGFVTNSSSSSYICVICNETYSGWDADAADAGMYQCKNGHTFCESHIDEDVIRNIAVDSLEKEIAIKKKDGDDASWEEEMLEAAKSYDKEAIDEIFSELDLRDNFPAEHCPVCTFEHLTDEDAARYLFKKFALKKEDVQKEMKQKFSDYMDFIKQTRQG